MWPMGVFSKERIPGPITNRVRVLQPIILMVSRGVVIGTIPSSI